MRKAVFLDRDGVINEPVIIEGKPYPPSSIEEFRLISGLIDGINRLQQNGYLIIVVTNQPDVARGKVSAESVEIMHDFLKKATKIDEIICCFHDDTDNCKCRKPKPGMLLDAAERWNIDLSESFMVGDRWKDIEAGKVAGVTTCLIDYQYDEKWVKPDIVCTDFKNTVDFILNT